MRGKILQKKKKKNGNNQDFLYTRQQIEETLKSWRNSQITFSNLKMISSSNDLKLSFW